jgi:hypothetical protein
MEKTYTNLSVLLEHRCGPVKSFLIHHKAAAYTTSARDLRWKYRLEGAPTILSACR